MKARRSLFAAALLVVLASVLSSAAPPTVAVRVWARYWTIPPDFWEGKSTWTPPEKAAHDDRDSRRGGLTGAVDCEVVAVRGGRARGGAHRRSRATGEATAPCDGVIADKPLHRRPDERDIREPARDLLHQTVYRGRGD